jgi:hypothetical protein
MSQAFHPIIALAAFSTACFAPAAATAKTQYVDLSQCANALVLDGQPVGTVRGNAGTPLARQRFKLLDSSTNNNVWLGESAGKTAVISLSVTGVSAVYALINTGYGQPDISNLTVAFEGTSGAQANFEMIGNKDVRDHWNWVWTNDLVGNQAQQWWTNNLNPQPQDQTHRLDAHKFNIGSKFSGQTLTKLSFIAPSGAAPNVFQPFVAAVKVVYSGTAGATNCIAQ